MVKKLTVKNFGPIKDVEIELTKNMIFIGPQSSGKSTLAKLIAICADIDLENSKHIHGSWFYSLLPFYNIQGYLSESTYIEIRFGEERIVLKDGIRLMIENLIPQGVTYIPSERSILPILSNSIMSLTSSGVPIPKNILFFGGEFEKTRNIIGAMNGKLPIFNDITYKYDGGIDKLVLDEKTIIKLSEASSGFQSAIPMLMVLQVEKMMKNHSFVVEEPEQNLYPTSQKAMAYFLAECCSRQSNLFCITTHSPYILTSLNNCLLAHQSGHKNEVETTKVIPKSQWLDPKKFSAYYVGNGTVKSIFNKEEELIDEDYLDSASDDILYDFDRLLDLLYDERED